MKVIIFGASGMIGRGVLLECLDDNRVSAVLSIGRSPLNDEHPKLKQIIHKDFTDFTSIQSELKGYDACYFCLGISAAGLKEEDYRKITYDFTLASAKTLLALNPEMTFVYVSGEGTDSTEKGRMMWARVKGRTENDLLALGFRKAYMFRPGIIIPLRGIKSRTPIYRFTYSTLTWLLKLIRRVFPRSITDTTLIGQAMINAHLLRYDKDILRPADINALAELNKENT